MKKVFCYVLIMIAVISCSEKKKHEENSARKTAKYDTISKTDGNDSENDSDCVFDDDYKKITEQWLQELEITEYTWDPKNNRASLIFNGDTLHVYKGGCSHFTSSIEIKTAFYPNRELDTSLIRKIKEAACKFKFDNYCTAD